MARGTEVPADLTDVVAIAAGSLHRLAVGVEEPLPVSDPNGPHLGPVNTETGFDGTASSDPDGDVLLYDWDWGDTTSSEDAGATPPHAYSAAGIHDVCHGPDSEHRVPVPDRGSALPVDQLGLAGRHSR